MGGKASYDFQDKNHWRRWWVNRFADGCGGSRTQLRDARLLFLCGHEGGEGDDLCEKGFSRRNLIACDIDPRNTAMMREKGFAAVTGDFCTEVACWPDGLQLSAIAADFCGPLNLSAEDFIQALLSHKGLREGLCVGINLSRGRDPESNQIRSGLSSMFFGKPRWGPLSPIRDELHLHRGWFWYLMLLGRFTKNVADNKQATINSNELAPLLDWSIGAMEPRFYTYKSGNICMDSLFFKWPGELKIRGRCADFEDQWCKLRDGRHIHGKALRINRRKIAAMRATARMQLR